jgi:uncharacterized protein (DUF362 family)
VKSFWLYNSLRGYRPIKLVVLFLSLSVWLWWDLSQAKGTMTTAFKSFFLSRDIDGKTSTPTVVGIVRSDDRLLGNPVDVNDPSISYATIEQMVRRAIDLVGGLRGIVKSGNTVLIKPNIVEYDPSGCGEVTDVRVVKALVKIVDEIDHGKIHIVVGEGSPRPFTAFEKATGSKFTPWVQLFDVPGYQVLKAEMVAAGVDLRLSNLNGNSDTNPWSELALVDVPGGGYAQPQAGKYYLHQDVRNADVFISVPVMKIHEPGITVAMKNQIGVAPSSLYGFSKSSGVAQDNYRHKLTHNSTAPYNWTDKEIVDLCKLAKIKFVVVDAIACLEEHKDAIWGLNGTVTNLVRMNTVIAGVDPVAVDHVCSRLMGLNPDDIEHITLGERAGLGTNDPALISIVGASIEATKKRFKKNRQPSAEFGQSNRDWLLNGPFPIGSISNPIDQEFIPNEASVAPSVGIANWSQSTYFINDRINLRDYYQLGASAQVVSYALSYFNAPADQQAELWVGSDEALKIYINGNLAYTYYGTRTLPNELYYSEIKKVSIKRGLNRLLVKSLQKSGSYDFSLNICEVESDASYKGNRIWGLKFTTDAGAATGIRADQEAFATEFELQDGYPNPFNGSIRIPYKAPKDQEIALDVYNTLGQKVKSLFDARMGVHSTRSVTWDATNERGHVVASGPYLVVLLHDGNPLATKRIVFLK